MMVSQVNAKSKYELLEVADLIFSGEAIGRDAFGDRIATSFGCVGVVGFVVQCVGFHAES